MVSKFTLLILIVTLISLATTFPVENKDQNNKKEVEEKDQEKKQEDKPKVQQKSYKYSYYREYGDPDEGDKNDKGFMRKTDEGGSKGYKHFDSFEKKGGDKYEFHDHKEFREVKDDEQDSDKEEEQKGDGDNMEVAESKNYLSFAHDWDDDHAIPHFDIDWEHFFDHHDHGDVSHDHEAHPDNDEHTHDVIEHDDIPKHDAADHDHHIPHFDIDWDHFFDHDQGEIPKDHESPTEHINYSDHDDHSAHDVPPEDNQDNNNTKKDEEDHHDIEFDSDPTFDHIPEDDPTQDHDHDHH
nr:histidine-rich glycoprotein-like [Onthophagus taurus]